MPSPLQSCRQQQYYVARDDRIPLVAEKASNQTVANLPPVNQLLQQSANGNYRLPPPLKRAVTFPRGSYPTTTNPCGLFSESEQDPTNDPPAASHSGLYKKSHSLTSVDTLDVRQALLRFDASQKNGNSRFTPCTILLTGKTWENWTWKLSSMSGWNHSHVKSAWSPVPSSPWMRHLSRTSALHGMQMYLHLEVKRHHL